MSIAEMDELEFRAEERRLLRKVDWILMPILTVTLGLQYYDKAVLGNAAVFGILPDLHLTQVVHGVTSTKRYSTATAAFYWGYIVAVLPMALLFVRLPLAKTAGVLVCIWGIICLLTVVCTDYRGFVAQRFFLGLIESAVSPAFVAVTALWYKPQEQAKRLGIWYSSTGIFSMISGVINYGLGHANTAHAWKSLYYFCGSLTMVWSFVIFFLMPTSPHEPGRFFSSRDREIIARRFRENPFGKDKQPFRLNQFVEAVLDYKTWIYLLMAASIYLCNGAVTAFGARIISGFGYTSLQSTALLIPGGSVTCVTIYIFAYFADRHKNVRTYLLPLSCLPVIVGAITVWTAPWHPRAGPLIGYYLVASFGAPYVLLLSLATANTLGTTKKAVTSGAIFVGYNAGNIAAAYLVFAQEAKIKYRSTWIAVIVGMVFASLASVGLRFAYIYENKKRSELQDSTLHMQPQTGRDVKERDVAPAAEDDWSAYEDKTDKQREEFRYTL